MHKFKLPLIQPNAIIIDILRVNNILRDSCLEVSVH